MEDDITKTLKLEPFFGYLIRKMTPQFVERLSWYEFIIQHRYEYLDVTTNKSESSHQSLNTYLKKSFLYKIEIQSGTFIGPQYLKERIGNFAGNCALGGHF